MWKFEIRNPRFCSIQIRTVWTFIKNYILRLQNVTQMCPFQYLNPGTFSYKTTFIKNASKVLFRDGTVAIYFCWNWINLESKSFRPKARISSLLTHERTWNIDIFKIKVIKLSKSSIHIRILNSNKKTDDIHQMKNFLDYTIFFFLFTVWPEPIWITVSGWWQIPPQNQRTYLRGPESASIEIPTFRPKFT